MGTTNISAKHAKNEHSADDDPFLRAPVISLEAAFLTPDARTNTRICFGTERVTREILREFSRHRKRGID